MDLSCTDTDELLAAFSLDALEAGDRLGVLEHLADCRLHDAEVAELRSLNASLAATVVEVTPPPRLRENLLAAFDASVAAERQETVVASPIVRRAGLAGLRQRTGFAYAVAAAALILAVAAGAWGISRGATPEGSNRVLASSVGQPGMAMRIFYMPAQKLTVVDLDMPALPQDRVYQGWEITDAGPVSMGLLPNRGIVVVPGDMSSVRAVAVSIEPAGGSPAPTTQPILVSEL